MILTLEVIGGQSEDLGMSIRKVFDSIGGTIGRLPDNDWVFPDPYISGRHALIRYVNGKFFVEDTSTNGVFINTRDNRLSRTQAHQLKSGDCIFIDAYQIQVSIEKPAAGSKNDEDPFELLKARAQSTRNDKTVALLPKDDDRTEAMGRAGDDQSMEWFDADDDAATPAPAVKAAPAPQPERPTAPTPERAPERAPVPERAPPTRDPVPATVTSKDGSLQDVLAAAGIQGVEGSPELAKTLGEMLRASLGGLMEVLRGRERMKDDLRLRGTTFKEHHNNPLKFSANVDDAFHNLLVKHNAAYLAPPEAVEDALRDVRDHQAAIIAAMRLAFESTLAQFDPTRLQEEFDRQAKKGSILGVPVKLRYWDMFCEKYGEIAGDADASFRELFGEEFAKAYEEQLSRLQALARSRAK